jgi:hypothetical protein
MHVPKRLVGAIITCTLAGLLPGPGTAPGLGVRHLRASLLGWTRSLPTLWTDGVTLINSRLVSGLAGFRAPNAS